MSTASLPMGVILLCDGKTDVRLGALPSAKFHVAPVNTVEAAAQLTVATNAAAAPFSVVAIAPGWEHPLRAARAVHALAPSVHILLLAGPDRLGALQEEVALAPMLGSSWSLVACDDPALPGIITDAVNAAAQRRAYRTTIDRMNTQIAQRAPEPTHDFRRLLLSDRLLAQILTHSADAIISVDTAGLIYGWNRRAALLFGLKESEVLHRPLLEVAAWSDNLKLMLDQMRNGQSVSHDEVWCKAKTGDFDFDVTVTPIRRDDEGESLGFVAIMRDITERKRTLASERAARQEAQSASRAKDMFLAVLSHELRTPLSPVVMAIPALEHDPALPPQFREDLAMVRRNIDLEVKLIDDLLDLSRVTAGKLRLHMQNVHVHELLRHVMQSGISEASAKRLILRQELAAPNDKLIGDPARLQQVFWNLLRNAVKFTSDGGSITVRTRAVADGDRLQVEIQDTGLGIAAEALPRIFDAFDQGDVRTTRQFGGLGLGLAIAKAVVEMHGGKISAASDGPGKGATFTVDLALAAPGATIESPAADGTTSVPAGRRALRILLVEDHPDTARTLARCLAISGFVVQAAGSVAAALALAAAAPFDVLVSDIGLPDATGYDLMREIDNKYGIKGIALSGYGMEEDLRKSRESGFVEHLVKPVNMAQLEAALRRLGETAVL